MPPHDHLFQLLFADAAHAVPLLRSAVPAPVAAAIDWPSLVRRDPAQPGRRGHRTVCDLLFTVRTTGGHRLLLYVVLEHKSAGTRFDALQMLEQVTAVLRTHRREHPRERFLPPVLPVVVHAHHRPWRSPLDIRDLFDLAHLPVELHRYLPSLTFVLDDLHQQPPERLRQRALSILGLCGLSTLQFLPPAANDPRAFADWVAAWRDVLQQASRFADETSAEELFAAVVDYVLDTCALPRRLLHRVLDHQLTDDAMKKKFVSTLAQTRDEGKAEGRAELLLRQLTRRFGAAAAASVEARIRGATVADLDRFAERVLDATTLDDLFAAPERR